MKVIIIVIISLFVSTTSYAQLSVGAYAGGKCLYYKDNLYTGTRAELQKIQPFSFPQMEDENILLLPSSDKTTLYIFGRTPWGKWAQIYTITSLHLFYELKVVQESTTCYFINYKKTNGESDAILIGSCALF